MTDQELDLLERTYLAIAESEAPYGTEVDADLVGTANRYLYLNGYGVDQDFEKSARFLYDALRVLRDEGLVRIIT